MTGTVVVGIGNPARGDDAAGREVARRLRGSDLPDTQVVESDGDVAALIQTFEGRTRCIVVDASHCGLRPGTVQRLEAHAGALPASFAAASTHALGLADAIELARALGQLPAAVVVYAIEGRSYAPGGGLSGPVRHAVAVVARRIRREVHPSGGPLATRRSRPAHSPRSSTLSGRMRRP